MYLSSRYIQAEGYRIERISGNVSWFPEIARSLLLQKIGFEDSDMSVSTHANFVQEVSGSQANTSISLVPSSDLIGMFCKLGSLDASLPVVVAASKKEV